MKNITAILFLGCFLSITASYAVGLNSSSNEDYEKKSTSEAVMVAAEYYGSSSWEWSPVALSVLESYVPFIFRTKKSSELEELEVLVAIDAKGKIKSYKLLNAEEDRGLRERIGYALRQMPKAEAVPGRDNYEPMEFKFIFYH